jgi:hypothetical protein
MAFDWKEYVALALSLQQQAGTAGNPEAVLRSALSRVYYGAFCYARNYARDWLRFRPRYDGDDHGRLREHLKRTRRRAVSDKLQRLREWRNESDYQDQLAFDPESILGPALHEARYVFSSLAPPATPSPP